MTKSMRRKLLASLTAAALAAGAVGVAIGTAAEDPPRADPDGGDIALDQALAERFAVLTTREGPEDAIPDGLISGPVSADLTLNDDLARRVGTYDDGRTSYVVPGDNGICLALVAGGESKAAGLACNSTAEVKSGEIGPASLLSGCVISKSSQTPQCSSESIYGLAPDGVGGVEVVMPDGTKSAIEVESNVYVIDLDGADEPAELSWKSPSGETLRRFPLAGQ
ncbi:MAG: hypothetical protein GXY03_06155 [Solirubrobacterales bacterium]|nr:hypothetical protein [Solirubrobacterales bacterium]